MRKETTMTKRKNTTTINDIVNVKNIIAGTLFGCCMIGFLGVVMILR